MPVLDGIEATRRIVEDDVLNDVRVVILTNYGLDENVFMGFARVPAASWSRTPNPTTSRRQFASRPEARPSCPPLPPGP